MTHNLNKKNNNYVRITATIFTLAVIAVAASSMATVPVAEATATTTEATTTTPPAPSSPEIELSPEPVYQEQLRDTGVIPINQTHLQITYSGSGTLNLPNGTETIRTTSSGSGIASIRDNDFAGQEILTTEDGSESATARVYDLVRFNMQDGTGRGIAMAVFHTNSTGTLAPLDGMILAGIIELYPDGTGLVTLSEWQSGIPLQTATTAPEEPALTDTTTTDDATGDTDNATEGAATTEEEEQQEGEQETTPLQ